MTVRILRGDCRDVLKTLPGASVDLVIADPPYAETNLAWDRWPTGWLAELPRVMKPNASLWVFGSLRMFIDRAQEFSGWAFAQDVVWEKHNGSGSHADRFRKVHELVGQFYLRERTWAAVHRNPLFSDDATARAIRRKQKPQHWGPIGERFYESVDGGPRMLRSVWCCRSEHGRAIHPTQKPVGVVLPLIEYSCIRGGVVLDPFAGSGTTGVAAKLARRSAVLIEANAEYADMADRRVKESAPLLAEVAA